ncbi:AMP-dependent synthetase/ligase [Ancrocorticia sp.]|uniref:AMP-dependent synthetase/ligase n=1 Tax=Ancrocorticia sp. TaxID=2593684 RepID=UPI003F935117
MKQQRDGSWSEAPTVTLESHKTIPWMIEHRLKARPHDVCIERKSRFGSRWLPVTISEFHTDAKQIARGLVGLGLRPGDSLAIFAATSYEWSLIDVAALSVGIVVVPIYESDSAEQISWILEDSSIKLVVTDTAAHAALVESVRTKDLARTIVFDDDGLSSIYEAANDVAPSVVEGYQAALTADSLATIIYTSGTTGRPKGVELTHGNFVFSALTILKSEREIINVAHTRILLFLPLAHIMARIVFFYALASKGRVGHVGGTANLIADIGTFKPTALLVVPRVLEKVYNAAEAKSGGGVKLKIFRWAAQVAAENSERKHHGPIFRVKRSVARKLVWSKLTAILGKDCRFAVSAGAPLGKRLGHVFRGIGLTVIEAFGLTESTGPATANRPDSFVMGTVGQPIPGTAMKLNESGEVFLKGPHIMAGYHRNPEATAEVLGADGWFRTGDVGTIDRAGFLTITGRKKELIVTAGGKNVAPAVLEDKLRGHPLVSQVVVVGDQRPFVGALVTIDSEMLPGWLDTHDLPAMDAAAASRNPDVLAALQRAVDRTNKQVSRAESIRKFSIIPGDFTEDNGLLTPSLKVKRERVFERYGEYIEKLYGGELNEEPQGKKAK